jgi:hypothetical protein
MSYYLGPNDHTAAFRTGTHAEIAASIAASEPPPHYAPDGNPDDYETIPGQGTTDAAFFTRPKSAPQDTRPVRGHRKPA